MAGALTAAFVGAGAASAATYAWFVSADKLSLSADFRAKVAEHLKGAPSTDVILENAWGLFTATFGKRHLSWKCVRRSFIISILANLVACGLVILLNPHSELLANDTPVIFQVVTGWALIAVIPDYINLYKTRVILHLLTGLKSLKSPLFIVIILLDFMIGLVLFSAIFGTVEGILGEYFYDGILPSVSDVIAGIFNENLSHLWYLVSNGDYQMAFFITSMLPSAWLWASIGAMLLGRMWISAEPGLTVFQRIFDVDKSPIQSLGAVAAGLVFLVFAASSMIITVISRIEAIGAPLN